jgi:hypothetical protein
VKKHLKLDIHPNKIIMQKISQWINYVWAILKPYHRYARSRIYWSFEKALCSLEKNKGESIDKKHTLSQLNSYMWFIKHSSYRKRFFKLYKKYIKTININFSLNLQRMCFVLRE